MAPDSSEERRQDAQAPTAHNNRRGCKVIEERYDTIDFGACRTAHAGKCPRKTSKALDWKVVLSMQSRHDNMMMKIAKDSLFALEAIQLAEAIAAKSIFTCSVLKGAARRSTRREPIRCRQAEIKMPIMSLEHACAVGTAAPSPYSLDDLPQHTMMPRLFMKATTDMTHVTNILHAEEATILLTCRNA